MSLFLMLLFSVAGAHARPDTCSIHGTTRDPGGFLPAPQARVSARNIADGSTLTVVSSQDGSFLLETLAPGTYRLEAAKNGYANSKTVTLELAAGQNLSVDLPLGDDPSSSGAQSAKQHDFFSRLFKGYADDWKPQPTAAPADVPSTDASSSATTSSELQRRGYPAPVDGPPFPFSDWPYGGSIDIGTPWTQASPLMEALWSGPNGEFWKKSGVQIYGWLNAGCNVSTSHKSRYANFPEAYAEVSDACIPDQEVLYIEKQPDTVQTDHFDWGFRLTNLYGLDYRFTTANGYFSDQLLGKNLEYGYDLVMAYVDLYFPQVADGMNVRIGRYISLPDIEAQLAPNNYTYSHSILYTFDAYTQTGINTTTKLSDHWMLQVGLSAGNDVAPWVGEPNAKPTFNACVAYTWQDGRDNHYACLNSLNSGKYAYNNLQSLYYTWFHKFGSSHWHTGTEWWYMWEDQVPNIGAQAPSAAQSLLITGANGAYCNNPTALTCTARETAVVNYTERQFSKHDYLTIRNEFFDDMEGQRTGTKTKYSEHLLGWGHWIGTTILFRPEIRLEHSYDRNAYDSPCLPCGLPGTKSTQLTIASDVIFFF
jgi:Putative beta-barrel porin-2, OmpL-like. bbp2/Carboxypeptidase regulatory-like domain